MSKAGSRDKTRELGAPETLDRFDISHVRRDEKRVSMSRTMLLGGISKEDGWFYYYYEDSKTRCKQAMEGGYEAVRGADGKVVKRIAGQYPMVLMRIPQELRNEDLAKKRQKVNNAIISKTKVDKDGLVPEYLPGVEDGRKSVLERDRSADFDPLN